LSVQGTSGIQGPAGSGGGGGASSGSGFGVFNTGLTSSFYSTLTGVGSTIITLPSTAGKQYIINSIIASNIATNSAKANVIGAFDFNGGERSYFSYNIPIEPGTSVELLRKPQILNPSDRITMRSTDQFRSGFDNSVQVYVTYDEETSSDYFGVGFGTNTLNSTSVIGIFTSTTYPSAVESIRVSNITNTSPRKISVSVTNGITTGFLVKDLFVPLYSSVELLEIAKRINTNEIIRVQLDEARSIDVQVSGKKIVP
jgi:hypothetical protein